MSYQKETHMKRKTKDYEVLSVGQRHPAWLTLRLQDQWYVQAQVFDAPSRFGIGARDEDGCWLPGVDEENLPESARVSRLSISDDLANWGPNHEVYNYDRGLDHDETPPGLLEQAIRAVLDAIGEG